jgi:enediyne biosynthesis protein E4
LQNTLFSIARLIAVALSAAAVAGPIFEVALPHGVDFTLQNSPTPQKYLIDTMPGGVALLDYNNDGLLDVFFVNGGHVSSPMKGPDNFERHDPKYWNRLYRQNKDGSFTDVTEEAGLSKIADGDYGMGVAVGDYDNDGYPDIYVTNYGKNILYHNNGNGTFTDVTEKAGVAAGGWSVSAGFVDYDNDGKLDLFVTRYMEWDTQHRLWRKLSHLLPAGRVSANHKYPLSQSWRWNFRRCEREGRHRVEERSRAGSGVRGL